jgi:hypothetical protein
LAEGAWIVVRFRPSNAGIFGQPLRHVMISNDRKAAKNGNRRQKIHFDISGCPLKPASISFCGYVPHAIRAMGWLY